MRRKKLILTIVIILFAFSFGYILVRPAFNYLSGFLSKSEQVRGNILLVEGWLPDYALATAYEEFQKNRYEYIVTTGMKAYPPYYTLYTNGFLIFHTKKYLRSETGRGQHTIDVNVFSELGGEHRAHFNVFVNDSIAGNYIAEKRKAKYRVKWDGSLNTIDSIMVEFNNDNWGDFGDRNLYVKEVTIDDKITIPYLKNSVFQWVIPNGIEREAVDVDSNAEAARNRLLSLGMDSAHIFATPCEKVRINRTLTSAIAFKNWVETTKIDITGINIISMGNHARRTWMTYNKVLNEKYKIGIVSLPDQKNTNSIARKVLNTLRETAGIIYYWFILLPY